MSANYRVPTRASQDAVKGREAVILDALGIDGLAGRPHITCRYPAHDDSNPDWRWHDNRGRALCIMALVVASGRPA
jgi:hypothetical protein